jgi:hypothetical protein
MVWDVLDGFAVDNALFVPYWRNRLSQETGRILVSSWERGNEKLLVLFNSSYQEEKIVLGKYALILDTLDNNKSIAPEISMPPRSFKLLKVTER